MKKLMIAAAAAAMIGGAEARIGVYDFVANVTTTTSAEGEAGSSDAAWVTATLGDNGANMWYMENAIRLAVTNLNDVANIPAATPSTGYSKNVPRSEIYFWRNPDNYPNLEWTTMRTSATRSVPHLQLKAGSSGVVTQAEATFLRNLKNAYERVSGAQCCVISWIPPVGGCYRVQSVETITKKVGLDLDCCTLGGSAAIHELVFNNAGDMVVGFLNGTSIDTTVPGTLYNHFGGRSAENSPMVEIFAQMNGFRTALKPDPDGSGRLTRGNLLITAYIAGQGFWQTFTAPAVKAGRLPTEESAPIQITGNIVGSMEPEVCGCCDMRNNLDWATAFVCPAGTAGGWVDPITTTPPLSANPPDTALFGSFYLLLNHVADESALTVRALDAEGNAVVPAVAW